MSAPAVRLHQPAHGLLDAVDIVLVRPSHPGNVGAAARAMRVMGLRHLLLVDPPVSDVLRHPEALARASGATDVLARGRRVESLADALASVSLAVAVSADVREFGPPPQPPEAACAGALAHLRQHPDCRVAFVFGAERTGLLVQEVAACQRLCSIVGDPDYNSLNLAQAVQVVCYVLRQAAGSASVASRHEPPTHDVAAVPGALGTPAPLAEVEGLLRHLEQALVAIGYLDPAAPRKLMPRLRRLFARTGLERDELNILRGICRAMEAAAGTPDPRERRRRGH